MSWLLDTLVWTGALIALVLVIRRPVARHFGAPTAYALWGLPLLRLLLPPIVLPASLAPPPAPVAAVEVEMGVDIGDAVIAAAPPEVVPAGPDIWTVLAVAWLLGALAYVVLRLAAYRRLRGELLAEACAVGSAGRVRLVETPAIRSPLAFGVIDKVVALPPGFMAQPDRAARDLALAHELAHHRAHDLAANFAALPLFALHWFNPLSWLGWNAMRRDQEAACDARVVDGRARAERAAYAALIARAVAAPKFALAAPMACPVLGDKSIVHRLRNLTMTDHSIRRRRAGRALLGLAALALPLTASFSYAQSSAPDAPEPPAPPAAPVAVEAPLPPSAPDAPGAPAAPEPPRVEVHRIVVGDGADGKDGKTRVLVIRDVEVEPLAAMGEGKGKDRDKIVRRKFVIHGKDGDVLSPDDPAFKERMRALEERLGKLDEEIDGRIVIDEKRIARITADASAHAARAGALAMRMAPRVIESCEGEGGVSETRSADGRREVRICHVRLKGHAVGGLRAARAAIAGNAEMSAETRAEVLEKLDREIARLEAGS